MYAGIHRISATSRKRTRKDATKVRPTRPEDDITNCVIVVDLPPETVRPLDVEHLAEPARDRAVVGIGGHYVAHVRPPAPAHLSRGDRVPSLLVIDLGIPEQIARLFIEVDGVRVHAMGDEHVFELLPDRPVPALVLGVLAGVHRHAEGFADHAVTRKTSGTSIQDLTPIMRRVTRHVAIDVGAESGRVMLGSLDGRVLRLREVNRFANEPVRVRHSLHWDMDGIYDGIETGLNSLGGEQVTSVGVDTWGCDYGLVDERGELLDRPHHYRDHRTDGVMARVLERLGRDRVYGTTGIQCLPFNTLYQLVAARESASRGDGRRPIAC